MPFFLQKVLKALDFGIENLVRIHQASAMVADASFRAILGSFLVKLLHANVQFVSQG